MTKAVFEEITGEVIGVIRVYQDEDDVSQKPPYKFFTIASVIDGEVEIIGMNESKVGYRDALAIADELLTHPRLAKFNLTVAHWEHNGERRVFDLAKRRAKLESK